MVSLTTSKIKDLRAKTPGSDSGPTAHETNVGPVSRYYYCDNIPRVGGDCP